MALFTSNHHRTIIYIYIITTILPKNQHHTLVEGGVTTPHDPGGIASSASRTWFQNARVGQCAGDEGQRGRQGGYKAQEAVQPRIWTGKKDDKIFNNLNANVKTVP